MNDANQVIDNTLAIVIVIMHATRCAVSTPIRTTPGTLVYGRNIIMNVPLIANLTVIWDG